jgi:hypothetical protein
VTNQETGAVAVLKVTLLTNGEEYDDNIQMESVTLCDAKPFVAVFGDLYFTQNYQYFMSKPLVYRWENHEKPEIDIYRDTILSNRTRVYFPTLLPPAIQPKVEPVIGYFYTETIENRFMLPETGLW